MQRLDPVQSRLSALQTFFFFHQETKVKLSYFSGRSKIKFACQINKPLFIFILHIDQNLVSMSSKMLRTFFRRFILYDYLSYWLSKFHCLHDFPASFCDDNVVIYYGRVYVGVGYGRFEHREYLCSGLNAKGLI